MHVYASIYVYKYSYTHMYIHMQLLMYINICNIFTSQIKEIYQYSYISNVYHIPGIQLNVHWCILNVAWKIVHIKQARYLDPSPNYLVCYLASYIVETKPWSCGIKFCIKLVLNIYRKAYSF